MIDPILEAEQMRREQRASETSQIVEEAHEEAEKALVDFWAILRSVRADLVERGPPMPEKMDKVP